MEKISLRTRTVRFLSICLMIFCIGFLTTLNYYLYPSSGAMVSCHQGEQSENDTPASGPTEEKTAGSGLTIAEEIFHETHPEINFESSNFHYLHHIAESEKTNMFHPELILPPPKV